MLLLWFTALAACLASLFVKFLADAFLAQHISLIGSFLGLTYASNDGIAFSIRLHGAQTFFILAALGLVTWLAVRTAHSTIERIAYGCIIGGAAGNLLDRVRDGLVTDFIHVGTFPIFNLADSFITVGAVLLIAYSLGIFRSKHS